MERLSAPQSDEVLRHAGVARDQLTAEQVWLLEQYDRLGFSVHEAELLLDSHADWHALERLLDDGCPHILAREIVR